jgi:hypothetical protein
MRATNVLDLTPGLPIVFVDVREAHASAGNISPFRARRAEYGEYRFLR